MLRKSFPNVSNYGHLRERRDLKPWYLAETYYTEDKSRFVWKLSPPPPNLLILQKPAEGHEADRTLEMQFYTDISGSLVKTPFFKGNSHSYMGKRWKRVIFHRCSLTLSPCKTICITLSQENELYLQQIYLPGKDFLQSSVLKKASWGVSCCLFYLHLRPNSWQLHGVFTLGNLILFILLHF